MTSLPNQQSLYVFVSSPNDVQPEREIIAAKIYELNSDPLIRPHYNLIPLLYEHEVPPTADPNGGQGAINAYMHPRNCYLFICLFWNRMGSPFVDQTTGKKYKSGTYYEFLEAYRSAQPHPPPYVLLYRKTTLDTKVNPDQQKLVNQFFDKYRHKGLYKEFDDSEKFAAMLSKNIKQILAKYPPPSDSHQNLVTSSPLIDKPPSNSIKVKMGDVKKSTVMIGIQNSNVNNNGRKD